MLNTPVLFLVFNRLEPTQRVFERIREARPKQLFIAADGPRPQHPTDAERCQAVREYLLAHIDWDCALHTLFRDQNLGCGQAVSQAITWFFEHVPQGIILEDDTLPDPSFFYFCQTLLHHYQDDERVMHIAGTNFQFGRRINSYAYYFSKYIHVWGWATWRRAWQKYTFEITPDTPQWEGYLGTYHLSKAEKNYWLHILQQLKTIDTWDYQWFFSIWRNNGLSAVSNHNLITNIGFDQEATHTKIANNTAFLPTKRLDSIIHPQLVLIDEVADKHTFTRAIAPNPTLSTRLKHRFSQVFRNATNFRKNQP
ncbi:hypothetical protein [Eisenibacter elegans]|jgi:hypothetical protein|uniref:hypothetical protein n=1 Tax=Eisenibacter elegans TaxID=997 RepID=UPI0003FEE51E|nr:hypothetical protein [Eisenibacter elegans]